MTDDMLDRMRAEAHAKAAQADDSSSAWGDAPPPGDDDEPGVPKSGDVGGHPAEQQPTRRVHPPGDPLPNARRFIAERFTHPEHPRLVCHGGAFYRWDGAAWPEVEEAALRADLYGHFDAVTYIDGDGAEKPFRPNRQRVADLLDALRAAGYLPKEVTAPTWLDDDGPVPASEVVACANGLLHVPTRRVYEHTPRFYAHHAVPFAYDPGAAEPTRWLRFLRELWPDDPEAIECLQEIAGYLISGDTGQQKMFLFVGPRRSGKGTIARVLTGLLGPAHVAGPTLASLAQNFGLQPLLGKPVAIVSDARIRSGHEALTERLLSISGEDYLTVDRKYRAPWTGRLPTRFLILTNELPRLADTSGALASRFVVLTMTQSFYGREDTTLTERLLPELPGILNWSLDGLDRLRARGRFTPPASSVEAIRELEDLGSPVTAFVRDRCVTGPELWVAIDALYEAWRKWCADHGRDRPGTQQTFGRDLRAVIPGIKTTQPRDNNGDRFRAYQGVGLKVTAPQTL